LDKGNFVAIAKLAIPRAYEAVQRALEEAILDGSLTPGAPLPTETDLAAQFGVARHTVREGMRALEQSGLVKRDAARRLHVTLPRYDALALMQRVSFRELWEVAMHVELCAIDLAMRHADADLGARLQENIAAMEAALRCGESISRLDVAFHDIIANAAHNRVLLLSREPVSLLFYPTLERLFAHPKTRILSPRRLLEAHRFIAEAVGAGQAAQARIWMHRHMADFRRGYEHAGIDLDAPADTVVALR
jgi:GntR family transcriptional repressor for pyruvate dehydrogenase complex